MKQTLTDRQERMNMIIKEGSYAQLGVSQQCEWTNFTFCGEKEDQCFVVLLHAGEQKPERIAVPEEYCLGSLRSIAIKNLKPDEYTYYFEINGNRVMDPYAHGIRGRQIWNDSARREVNYEVCASLVPQKAQKCKILSPETDRSDMIMYKLHVRGFTMDSGTKTAGTFKAVINRIPYLKKLGITTVELMPVYEFEEIEFLPEEKIPEYIRWEEHEKDMIKPSQRKVKAPPEVNYWGYKEGNYFAVKASYASDPENASEEYRTLIRKLHENRMECIMEMYFEDDTNHNLILDALRYWVKEYQVDGFHLLGTNLPITAIVQDQILSRTKIFYVGFDEKVCRESRKYKNLFIYKDEYMYPARRILNQFNGNMQDFMNQQRKQGEYFGFVNYITGNNGFTLADLFMYNDKHNEANGEDNQDGSVWNFSNNHGVEGPTRKRSINAIRRRKWRNSMLMLFLAQGVPLIWSGDEICNSQSGNNNAYCQDNPIGWLNWKNEKTHQRELDFLRRLIAFRKEHKILSCDKPFQFSDYKFLGSPDLSYHGENAWQQRPLEGRQSLGVMYCGAYADEKKDAEDVYTAYNFSQEEAGLALPKLPREKEWYLVIDSSDDEHPFLQEPKACDMDQLIVLPQTICVLVSRKKEETVREEQLPKEKRENRKMRRKSK